MNLRYVFLLSTIFSSTACHGFIREAQQEYIINHLEKLRSYEGTMVESGALTDGEELISEITFERPEKYNIRVTAPAKHSGSVFYFDGSELLMYYPSTKFAITFKNIHGLSREDERQLLRDQFDWNMFHYHYEITGKGSVAGLKTEQMDFKSTAPSSLYTSGSVQIHNPISTPLSGTFRLQDDAAYSFKFTRFRFNEPDIKAVKPIIPSDATYSRWDLNSKNFTRAEMKDASNFKFKQPEDSALPRQIKLQKIIRQEGIIPAFTLLYEKRPYFLNLTVYKDYGVSGIPAGRGLTIKTGKKGTLIVGPHSTYYSFISGGTQYLMVGNLPAEEILALSESL